MEQDWSVGLTPEDVRLLSELQELKNQGNTLAVTFCDFVRSSERLRKVWGWNRPQQIRFLNDVIGALKKYNWRY